MGRTAAGNAAHAVPRPATLRTPTAAGDAVTGK